MSCCLPCAALRHSILFALFLLAARESRKARRRRVARVDPAAVATETPEKLRERHAAEWKEMKAKVSVLKKEKQRLPTKGGKESKIRVGGAIRTLMEDMTVRQVAELRAAGLHVSTARVFGKEGREAMMSDV